jgi:deaminated glutathione amidase
MGICDFGLPIFDCGSANAILVAGRFPANVSVSPPKGSKVRNTYLAAVVQMNSGEDAAANVATATRLVEEAARRGAVLVALPELFNCLGRSEAMLRHAEPAPGPTADALAALARRLGITLLAGSICERSEVTGKACNTSLLFGADGALVARYRKRHLFDIDLPGQVRYQESAWLLPGDEIVCPTTPVGRLGLSICYDLRFPEMYRRLADLGADVLLIPAAFTLPTGRDHWEVLLRARAIENQAFVIAPNQHGQHGSSLTTYGRSMIVDPWGTPLAIAPDGVGIALAEIDLDRLAEIRQRLPALRHRRG